MGSPTAVADLAAARVAIETVAATSILPSTTLGTSTYTWTEMLDLFQSTYRKANGDVEDANFHARLTQFYTDLEAELAL
tara:strand:+ start:1834 stop:2070 length:237 start_codon:yes stop_codon:yes gene_type:complete